MTTQQQQDFLAALDFQLPPDYAAFLFSQGAAPQNNTYYFPEVSSYLCSAAGLLDFNEAYQAEEFYPGYFLIGSNACMEVFAIEKATGCFVMTPFIGHDAETVIVISQTWPAFLQRLLTDDIYNEQH